MEEDLELTAARRILTKAANARRENKWLLDYVDELAPKFVTASIWDDLTRLERLHECRQ